MVRAIMLRAISLLLCLAALSGCRLPPERDPLRPLPEDGQIYSYAEILGRARVQATLAQEAFYVDGWDDLEEAAASLEQTARFLTKASEPPPRWKDKLGEEAKQLAKDVFRLRVAAQAKNVPDANAALQRIHYKIRILRPEPDDAPKKDNDAADSDDKTKKKAQE